MGLIVEKTAFDGVLLMRPDLYQDERGAFGRIFCDRELHQHGVEFSPVQINQSFNRCTGTLRGLHFQYPPFVEAKCVKCIRGAVFDVIVDVRKSSPTFLQVFSIELSEGNKQMLYIPPGFAHGFQTLEDDTQLLYLHSEYYRPAAEGGLNYADPCLNVSWPETVRSISERDTQHPMLSKEFEGILL